MYTDIESKITKYNNIKNFFKVALVIEVIYFFMELMSAITTGNYIFGVFTALLAVISLVMLKIVWKCKWKVEQYKHEKNM